MNNNPRHSIEITTCTRCSGFGFLLGNTIVHCNDGVTEWEKCKCDVCSGSGRMVYEQKMYPYPPNALDVSRDVVNFAVDHKI